MQEALPNTAKLEKLKSEKGKYHSGFLGGFFLYIQLVVTYFQFDISCQGEFYNYVDMLFLLFYP